MANKAIGNHPSHKGQVEEQIDTSGKKLVEKFLCTTVTLCSLLLDLLNHWFPERSLGLFQNLAK